MLVPGLKNFDQKAFFGIGFGVEGVPLDVLPIYQLSCLIPNFSLLVVDEFLNFNGLDKSSISHARDSLLEVLDRLSILYGNNPNIIFCSDFMHFGEYYEIFEAIKSRIDGSPDIADLVLGTVPENKRHIETARDYPVHEFACTDYLSKRGYSLKIGPIKEKYYDGIMQQLGFGTVFAYLLEAFALGTKHPDEVVHYAPLSRGPNNGQRIFFDEEERKVKLKLQQGCDEALRYFCKIACVSGYLLGNRHLHPEEISQMHGRRLKNEAVRLVFNNIIKPYMEVTK